MISASFCKIKKVKISFHISEIVTLRTHIFCDFFVYFDIYYHLFEYFTKTVMDVQILHISSKFYRMFEESSICKVLQFGSVFVCTKEDGLN